ncbi:uncharacterized protein ACO6RY_02339 [Pungitius sinensis]
MSEAKRSRWREGGNPSETTAACQWRTVQKFSPLHHAQPDVDERNFQRKLKKSQEFKRQCSICAKRQGCSLFCGLKKKSHQIGYGVDNRTYNHKAIMHTQVAYDV